MTSSHTDATPAETIPESGQACASADGGSVGEVRRGLALPFPGVALRHHDVFVRQAERLGYDDLWTGDNYGPDAFTPLVLAAACTERIRLGTGIVGTFTRGPAVLAQHAAALADASAGRFVLGLGSSSSVIVQRWNGVPFVKPVSKMLHTVAALRSILSGGRGPGGFKLDPAPEFAVPIVVAGLRPAMLQAAARVGDGVFLHAVPVSSMPTVIDALGTPRGEVVCRFHCIPGRTDDVLERAKRLFLVYATVPVYSEFFRWLGWENQLGPTLEAWQRGHRKDALRLCPDQLVREIYLLGSISEIEQQISRFVNAGVTTVVLSPLVEPAELAHFIEGLAPDRSARLGATHRYAEDVT